jgi:hypothetical protein
MPRVSLPCANAYSSCLDYLTLSAPTEGRKLAAFREQQFDLRDTLKGEGLKEERFGLSGYSGEKWDGVSFGTRESDGHALIAVHGWRTDSIAQWAIENDVDAICRRIDPAIVVEFKEPIAFYGEYLRKRVRAHEEAKGRTMRTPFTLFEKAKQDTGAYLGSRTSAKFARIYDNDLYHTKKTDFRFWKHEMEFKGVAAIHAWGKMRVSRDRNKLSAEMVTTNLKQHGIMPRGIEELELVPIVGTKPRSDFDIWLAWFKRSALPRAKKEMIEGHAQEVLAALKQAGILTPRGCFQMPSDQQELQLD